MVALCTAKRVSAALLLATAIGTPRLTRAAQASGGIIDAATLGVRAPNAQQIQQEIDLVHSQGVDIRVVGSYIRPTQAMIINGRRILIANAPVVEFEIGSPRTEARSAGAVSSTMAQANRSVDAAGVIATRSFVRPADSSYHWQWQDTANGSSGGYPSFYFTAHYTTSCFNGSCQNQMNYVSHEADNSAQGNTLDGTYFAINCSSTFGSFDHGGGLTWGTEYYDYLSLSCSQGSTYIWSYGTWHNSIGFESYFNKNGGGTTGFPGDYVKF